MSDTTTALVGTRKGLFPIAIDGATASVGEPAFLGSPVTNAVRDPRDGAVYASLDHGHFGVHLHRSDDGGTTWAEVAAPEYPPKPDGVADVNPMSQTRGRVGDPVRMGDRAGTRRTIRANCGAGRSPVVCSAQTIGASRGSWSSRCGTCPPGPSGSAAATTMPASIRSASTPAIPITSSSASRAVERGAPTDGGESWQVAAARHAGQLHAARAGRRPRHPRSASPRSMCRRPRRALVPAPLRDLPHHRQRRATGSRSRRPDRRRSGSPSPPTPTIRSRRGSCRPRATRYGCRSTAGWSSPAHVTADRPSTCWTRACPRPTPTTSIYRHSLAVDDAGERLLLGSTTGSLWFSADAGDTFITVSSNLPPVHSVRFA